MTLIFLIAVASVGWLLYHLYLNEMLKQGNAGKFKVAIVVLGIVFLALAVTGRAPAFFALIGALMTQTIRFAPLILQFAPSLKNLFKSAKNGTDGTSRVSTATVVVSMHHSSGEIDGAVIDGSFQGRQLSSLTIKELSELYDYCARNDAEACRLIAAYATRQRPDEWQNTENKEHEGEDQKNRATYRAKGPMASDEARQILGLDESADAKEIAAAHRSLIGKFHPDKGGNDYLATQLNTAREVLLKEIKRTKN